MRTFDTGATRDTAEGKPAYDDYLCPRVMQRFGEYMLKHEVQADGTRREPGNWKKGIPTDAYLASLFRHFMTIWLWREDWPTEEGAQDALCAIIFNAQGMLRNLLQMENAYIKGDGQIVVPGYPKRERPPSPAEHYVLYDRDGVSKGTYKVGEALPTLDYGDTLVLCGESGEEIVMDTATFPE